MINIWCSRGPDRPLILAISHHNADGSPRPKTFPMYGVLSPDTKNQDLATHCKYLSFFPPLLSLFLSFFLSFPEEKKENLIFLMTLRKCNAMWCGDVSVLSSHFHPSFPDLIVNIATPYQMNRRVKKESQEPDGRSHTTGIHPWGPLTRAGGKRPGDWMRGETR